MPSLARGTPVSEPDASILTWAAKNGVSRVAETTGLDRVGIPTAYAVRPGAHHPSTILSCGRGHSPAEAIRGALFEAFERWAAEAFAHEPVSATRRELASSWSHVLMALDASIDPDSWTEWAVGIDLLSGRPCFVPAFAATFPGGGGEAAASTSGLGSGDVPASAMLAAVLELIERDGVSRLDEDALKQIDPSSVSTALARLAARFLSKHIDLALVQCPSLADVPVFYCLSRDRVWRIPTLFCSGAAAHFDVEAAASRAMTEAAQSRAALISGLREDLSIATEKLETVTYETRWVETRKFFDAPHCPPRHPERSVKASEPATALRQLVSEIGRTKEGAVLASVEMRRWEGLHTFRVCSPTFRDFG